MVTTLKYIGQKNVSVQFVTQLGATGTTIFCENKYS